jgi:hypothetical protein
MAYLAPPTLNPIDIDAGAEYWYVVAQEGGTAVSVDPNANFTLSVQGVSPAMLKFTYTGATFAVPTFQTLTIRVTIPTGELLQTINLRVMATSITRQVPNITNAAGAAVAPGQPIDIAIGSDIPVDSYSVASAPAGLTYNASTNRLTGTAPAASGFYVITFVAHLADAYERYFVLIVGTGGVPVISGATIGWATPPNLSRCYFDGDFTTAQLAGPPQFEIPFKTDPKPYAYKLPYWQFLSNFADISFGTPGPLGGTYVGGSPGTFKSIGGGIIEFWREFALVPDTRSEFESFVYPYQFYFPMIGRSGTAELPITTSSRVQFDYFRTDDPSSIPLPRAPKMWAPGAVFFLNDWLSVALSPDGTEVLAQDSTLKQWKGDIFERQSRFIRWINPSELLFA